MSRVGAVALETRDLDHAVAPRRAALEAFLANQQGWALCLFPEPNRDSAL
jgi:hypothetical protein